MNIKHRSDALAILAFPTRERLAFLDLCFCLYPFKKNYRPDLSWHQRHAAITYVNAG